MLSILNNFDTNLFLYLNALHTPFFDKIMWLISGKLTWLPLYLAIIAHYIYHERKKSWLPIICTILAVVISDQISSSVIKPLFERLRPSHEPAIEQLVHIVNGYKGGLFGFVSSHAANSFAVAVFTSLAFRIPIYTWAIIAWAVIVSYSRIYLGVHYPADIMGGAIIGIFSALLMYFLYKKYQAYANNTSA
jgi:undecaprenyl-diphosphatase